MNSKIYHNTLRSALGAGLFFCAAVAASANTFVTFQVDMSVASTNGTFDPNTQTVVVRGNFESWSSGGQVALTNNPGGANPNLWTGTTNMPLNSYVASFKYVTEPGDGYESSHNRNLTLPPTSGASVTAPTAYFNDIPPEPFTNTITFQVNMAQQLSLGNFDPSYVVEVRGSFNSWGTNPQNIMTNDPSIRTTNQFGLVTSNVWVAIVTVPEQDPPITASPGQTIDYKFYYNNPNLTDPNVYESPAPNTGDPNDNNNRFFTVGTGPTQTLPIVNFSDSAYAPKATNAITFQVDMTGQIQAGNFVPSIDNSVSVRGDFNGWGQTACTNDVTAPNTNLYTTVVSIADGIGAFHSYKFYATDAVNGGWEIVAGDQAVNRSVQIVAGTAQTLPAVYFSDSAPGDLLAANTTVTFRVDMTPAINGGTFHPGTDTLDVRGLTLNAGANTWYPPFTGSDVALGMTLLSGNIYTADLAALQGQPLKFTYRYSIGGLDNENATHVRYALSTNTYVLPTDTFGTTVTENAVPNLGAAVSTPGHIAFSWLGRAGVQLQSSSSLSGPWTTVAGTDGASSASVAIGAGSQFFRLVEPKVPQ